jgi:lipopolysaccharide/colanic/teichoic acid biosynthesis glycosyltransferase
VSLLAASLAEAEEAIARLESIPGLRVVSALVPDPEESDASARLGRAVARSVGSRVRLETDVIVSSPRRRRVVAAALAQLVALGHRITSESAAMRAAEGRVDSQRADPLGLLMGRRATAFDAACARAFDLVVGVAMLVALSPLLLVTAAAVWATSGRPIFFLQRRLGRGGRMFHIVKFRTMRPDAEARTGPVYASTTDPRVTPVGRWLRRLHLDELPQLFNVLAGQMSIVGPRPERPHFVNQLRKDVPVFELRNCVRPGITGWAQVRLPYADDSEDARSKLEYDLYYVLHRSIAFDTAVLLETLGVALRGRGSR